MESGRFFKKGLQVPICVLGTEDAMADGMTEKTNKAALWRLFIICVGTVLCF